MLQGFFRHAIYITGASTLHTKSLCFALMEIFFSMCLQRRDVDHGVDTHRSQRFDQEQSFVARCCRRKKRVPRAGSHAPLRLETAVYSGLPAAVVAQGEIERLKTADSPRCEQGDTTIAV